MTWIEPRFNRTRVDWAGDALARPDRLTPEEVGRAFDIVSNWRSSHSLPMNKQQVVLTTRTKRYRPSVLVARRMKRLPSILSKLRRFPKMKLSRMQDIGGCRAIVADTATVFSLRDAYRASSTRDELVREDDYIVSPKTSGYRGIHLVYKYFSEVHPVFNGLQVEIQLRSRLQHTWATAVETVGLMTRQALKSSQGADAWLRFFSLMGTAIAKSEGTSQVPGTPTDVEELTSELGELRDQLQVESKLKAYSAAIRTVIEKSAKLKSTRYWLLEIDPQAGLATATGFVKGQFEVANSRYLEVEKNLAPGSEAVLVSVDSVSSLEAAYPSYFAESDAFIDVVKNAIDRASTS